jgi:hypothetical protein
MRLIFNPLQDEELQFFPADGELSFLVDTKKNILATTPTSGNSAFSNDTFEIFVGNGSVWKTCPFAFVTESGNPDIGWEQDSSRIGYGTSYVTDKLLATVDIGSNNNVAYASATRIPIRASGSTLQIYVSGAWQTIVSNFVFRENSTFGYTLEHAPIGFTTYIEVMSGDSLNNLGLNGLPLIQGYEVSMGAYPVPQIIGGRTIS